MGEKKRKEEKTQQGVLYAMSTLQTIMEISSFWYNLSGLPEAPGNIYPWWGVCAEAALQLLGSWLFSPAGLVSAASEILECSLGICGRAGKGVGSFLWPKWRIWGKKQSLKAFL